MNPNSQQNSLLDKMPHRPPMRLLDEIVHADETNATCLTRVDDQRINLFGTQGLLNAYLGIELIAQTAAVSLIFDSTEDDQLGGAIVQIRSFQSSERRPIRDDVLETRSEVELHLDGKIASVKGVVTLRGETICEGVITLALQNL